MGLRAILLGLLFALVWSSSFTFAHIVVEQAPPMTALVLRFACSGAICVALALAMGQTARLTPAQWRATVIFGICQNAIYLGLNWIAMAWIEASLAAIIASCMPLLVAAAGRLFLGDRLRPLTLGGLLAGLAGVTLIMGARLGGGETALGALALCVIAVLALTVATLSLRGAASGGNVTMVVGLQMLVGGAALVPFALFEDHTTVWSGGLIFAFAYSVLVSGVLATLIWFVLVGRIGATRAATFHFLNPVFGVLIAAVLLGESLRGWDLVGVAVVAAGILAVQIGRAEKGRPAPAGPATAERAG
ncbi:DMT family transporter [Pseudoroseicyclus aestuarii]|uniref:Threonine/homoserine efflux transporter RhtA n=1 Tax=Pseudoroseicyclus aestuarii TaxID=1795041 RepID=A0A318SW08_9RHOB|nr:DMT family transporter [Pseudoroseicyclus aestuarii]PYE84559.1 threonine/homoserine efflux transporter RhtA [Pseudoroseicyclus aestuarii]